MLSPLVVRTPYISGEVDQKAVVYYAFPLPEEVPELPEFRANMTFEQSLLKNMRVGDFHWGSFTLPEMLSNYGPPDEVLVHTWQRVPNSMPPFAIFLFYSKRGILAYLPSAVQENEVQMSGSNIRGCLANSATLYLWSPDEGLTLEEVLDRMSVGILDEDDKPVLTIDRATGMSIMDFYESYKNTNVIPCIETPKDLWPIP